ncbi:porin family protein [Pontibacter pudoricolor]|uniref:hypothetical protein n=1 Tax=Pontibacter pudoricolor TaxID=2694930 RepID=UPI0013910089|nr:hypothetical protein [Pontibacter pudoricolor]
MKIIFLSLILLVSTLPAVAQVNPVNSDSTVKPLKRVYVGVELSNIAYTMWRPSKQVGGGVTPVVHINVGYKLNKGLSLQIGLAYGRKHVDELSGIYYGENDTIINYYRARKIQALAVPITAQVTPFSWQQNRKFRVSAIASFVPIIGSVWHQESEEFEGQREVIYKGEDSGVYAIVTGGLQFNYKISQRLDSYGKLNLFYKNVGHKSYYADKAWSVGLGLNYNL